LSGIRPLSAEKVDWVTTGNRVQIARQDYGKLIILVQLPDTACLHHPIALVSEMIQVRTYKHYFRSSWQFYLNFQGGSWLSFSTVRQRVILRIEDRIARKNGFSILTTGVVHSFAEHSLHAGAFA